MSNERIHSADPEGERIMQAIRSGEVRMRPRWYFVLRAILLAAAAGTLFLLLLYVVSFIIFALHEDGAWFAPAFGASGWPLFAAGLPWGLLVLSFALLILLAVLLTRYSFVYHRPLFHFFFAFILVVIIGGFLIAATSLQPGVFRFAAAHVPFLGGLYRYETAYPAGIHRGTVVSLDAGSGSFVIVDDDGATTTVAPATGVSFFQVAPGDIVLVFGPKGNDGVIRAFGLHIIGIAAPGSEPSATSSQVR